MDKKGGEYHVFPSEIFRLTVPKSFVGNPFVFQKISGIEKIMDERWGYHVLPSEIFCLTVPKRFVGELFTVSENLGYRKISCIRWRGGGGYYDSPSENILSHFTEKLRRAPFCLTKFRVSKNFLHEGDITIFSQGWG